MNLQHYFVSCFVALLCGVLTFFCFEKRRRLFNRCFNIGCLFLCITILYLCTRSLVVDYLFHTISFSSFLLEMTDNQRRILHICLVDFSFDIGIYLRGATNCDRDDMLHHLFSIPGILFQLHYGIGGGLMVCLLLDSSSYFLLLLEDIGRKLEFWHLIVRWKHQWKFDLVYWIVWIASRLVWYPAICVYALWCIIYERHLVVVVEAQHQTTQEDNKVLIGWIYFCQLTLWTLYATYSHCYCLWEAVTYRSSLTIPLKKLGFIH